MSEALAGFAREGSLPLAVAGGCMEPRLPDGACVRVEARRFYWPGDLVAFRDAGGRIVVHRMLGLRGFGALLTQADRADAPDSAVAFARVLGRVAVETPFRDRLFALARFARFVGARLVARCG